MKRFLLLTSWILFTHFLFAGIPSGYYDSATGTGYTLKTQLYNIVNGHTSRSYGDLWIDMQSTDKKANGYVWDMYSDVPGGSPAYDYTFGTDQCGTYSIEGDCYNREHSFPKSWFADATPMYTDLFHLYPTDGKVNGQRSNYPFGEVGTASWTSTNGSKLGTCNYPGYTGTVFEPIDEYKGDFARTYFYMATRYENIIGSWETNTTYSDAVLDGTSDHVYEDWYLNLMLDWHHNDPVSQKEIDRNDAVYGIQNNRNPFIDHPEYVAQIWGGTGVFITNVVHTPTNPTSTNVVAVTATISSSGGTIVASNLKWGTSSGTYPNTESMTLAKGNYSANISAQTNGTNVYYIIESADDNAESASSSEYNYTVNDNPSVELINEDFTHCPATNWINYNVSGTENWECDVTNLCMTVNAFGSDVACNDWLISPAQNLDLYTNEVLSFTSWNKYNDNFYPPIKIKYSTDYSGSGDPKNATWTELTATWSGESSQAWTGSGDIDISEILGTEVYFAFHYTSSGTSSGTSAQWSIDNMLITGDLVVNEAPVITNIQNLPSIPTPTDDVIISATIKDDGTISSAVIKWGTITGVYPNDVTMNNIADAYTGIINAQANGTTVYYVIDATDDNNKTTSSNEKSFSFVSNSAPVIANIQNTPLIPTSSDDITISATITDDGTITSALIKWGMTVGNYPNEITMNYSGDTYSGIIPAQLNGTTVHYLIEAVDNELESTRSEENSFLVKNENILPLITNVIYDPIEPESTDNVRVSATITDSDGTISVAQIKWGLSSGVYPNNVTMSSSVDDYIGEIPAQADGTHVYFIVYTEDNEGGIGQSLEKDYIVYNPNALPVISNVTFDPVGPESTDNVRVSATITDSDGSISVAQIKWGLSGSSYINIVSMSSATNDYSGEIPAQADGAHIYFVVYTEDNEGGSNQSAEVDYLVSDPVIVIPIISDVLIDPVNPTENDNVVVSARATDANGSISSVMLKWKRGTGSFTNVGMNLSGGKYYGQIPKQATGETIYFTILATDNDGLEGSYDGNYDISSSNGVNDLSQNNFKIFPNPTSDKIHIHIDGSGNLDIIKLYNLIGEKILEINNLDVPSYTIEMNKFPKGMYILQIESEKTTSVRKIIFK